MLPPQLLCPSPPRQAAGEHAYPTKITGDPHQDEDQFSRSQSPPRRAAAEHAFTAEAAAALTPAAACTAGDVLSAQLTVPAAAKVSATATPAVEALAASSAVPPETATAPPLGPQENLQPPLAQGPQVGLRFWVSHRKFISQNAQLLGGEASR